LSWLGSLSPVGNKVFTLIEETIFVAKFDRNIIQALRLGKAVEDLLGDEPLIDKVTEIDDMLRAEAEKARPSSDIDHELLKLEASSLPMQLADIEVTDACEKTAIEEHPTAVPYALRSSVKLREHLAAIAKMGDDDRAKLTEFEREAERVVRELVTLVVEPGLVKDLATLIRGTTVGKMFGTDDDYILIYLDAKQLGESATQPWSREVPVQAATIKKLVGGALRARGCDQELDDNDLWIIAGGMKPGNETLLMNGFQTAEGKVMPKTKKNLHVIYSEEALEKRRDCPARGANTMHQCEIFHMVTKRAMRIPKKSRVHLTGSSTAGDTLVPVGLPRRDEGWQLIVTEKKLAYGESKRVLPGGPVDKEAAGTADRVVRRDKDLEPFSYWASSQELYEELLNYNVVGVIDLTAGNGGLAQACISASCPYLGVCYTEHHQDLLKRFLNQVAFTMKATEGHRLYSPELTKLCKTRGAPKAKAKATGTPNGKAAPSPKPKPGGAPEPTARTPLTQKALMEKLKALKAGAAGGGGDGEAEDSDDGEDAEEE